MGELVCINKSSEEDLLKESMERDIELDRDMEPEISEWRAVVPTIDIYRAKLLFNLTQKMVEDTVDRRVSLLEKQIEERDKEIMRAIRKIQSRTAIKGTDRRPWWQRLFQRGK